MNGIINVYKEQGFTSHDVVAKLRGILKMKKIGHTGTLDPDAVGVLPVCLGKGTRLCSLITEWTKTYEAVMLLGTTTDTQDISGKVLSKRNVNVNERDILEACTQFVGEYEQIPPMYSALKVNGRKLYDLAREGIEIERKPRRVNIFSLHINEINLSDEEKTVTFTVECSKGTYIRTLCDDIGKSLGCGACMAKLTRTRVGQFDIDNTMTLNQIAAAVLKGNVNDYVVKVDDVLSEYEYVVVSEAFTNLLYNGNRLPLASAGITAVEGVKYRLYDSYENFIGLYIFQDEFFVPVQIFYENVQ